MYNGSRSSRFSRNRGGAYRGNSNRPHQNGGFNRGGQNMGGRMGPAKSKLIGADINIFIKQAVASPMSETYIPHNSFADFPINATLKQNIVGRGYTHPTPIQDKAIQPILDGRDLIGLANTGTGKTAAFLIPLIDKISKDRNQKVVIITPTRELAVQINNEFRSFAENMQIYSNVVIGGSNINRQIQDLRRNPHVVIGTPGRIKDLINKNKLNLREFRNIVLDEVDLMVDIGFIADVKYFISLLPTPRQSLFFSATISPKIREILNNFVTNPVTVTVQEQQASENVDQNVIKVVDRNKKVDLLHDLLIREDFNKVMVFGRTKHGIKKLDQQLTSRGFKVGSIHGNKSQSQRQSTLQSFKQNKIQVLLATDVASRGLDIDDVSHVINYDLPETYEDYIHRIGRTGRMNKKGIALTFVE